MRTTETIASDIRQITQMVVEASDDATLECLIHGTASGIPGAFIQALDRADPTFQTSETLHELLAEYAAASAVPPPATTPKAVILKFERGKTFISTI